MPFEVDRLTELLHPALIGALAGVAGAGSTEQVMVAVDGRSVLPLPEWQAARRFVQYPSAHRDIDGDRHHVAVVPRLFADLASVSQGPPALQVLAEQAWIFDEPACQVLLNEGPAHDFTR